MKIWTSNIWFMKNIIWQPDVFSDITTYVWHIYVDYMRIFVSHNIFHVNLNLMICTSRIPRQQKTNIRANIFEILRNKSTCLLGLARTGVFFPQRWNGRDGQLFISCAHGRWKKRYVLMFSSLSDAVSVCATQARGICSVSTRFTTITYQTLY